MCAAFSSALSAAVFYAAVILLNKYITGVPALERTFVQFLAAILVLTPYVALTSGFHPGVMSAAGWVNLLIVGLVHTGLTYCMYSLRHPGAAGAGVVAAELYRPHRVRARVGAAAR